MERLTPYLLVLALLLLLLWGVMVLVRRRQGQGGAGRGRKGKGDELDTVAGWEPSTVRVLSVPEREAFHTLRTALPEHMILAQVPLARFMKVPTRNSYSEWLRRVGSLCADLVICDATAQVVAVVEVRQPFGKDKERNQKRHARMDRVLEAAKIPVHVWLDNALPGPAVARETILGAAVVFTTKSGATLVDTASRAKAPPLPTTGGPRVPTGVPGLAVNEGPVVDFDLGEVGTEPPLPVADVTMPMAVQEAEEESDEVSRRMSTWFESAQPPHSGKMPLDGTPRR
jgi:Protein of unknown function (DUF2726)